MFFWEFLRLLKYKSRRFGTQCRFHRPDRPGRWNWHWFPKRRLLYFRLRGNSQKNIDNLKSLRWKQRVRRGRYLLLSSKGREIVPMLLDHLSTKYEIKSIFKPNVPLVMSLRTWESLVMTLPSDIVLVQWEGQEMACVEIAIIQRTSCSLQRGQIRRMSDF